MVSSGILATAPIMVGAGGRTFVSTLDTSLGSTFDTTLGSKVDPRAGVRGKRGITGAFDIGNEAVVICVTLTPLF